MITIDLPEPTLSIELPLPPASLSPNAKKGSSRIAKSRDVKAYRSLAGARWRDARTRCPGAWRDFPLREACIRYVFYWEDALHRDDDNAVAMMKSARDGAPDGEVIVNDRVLVTLPPVMSIDRKDPRVVVELYCGGLEYREVEP